MIASLDTILAAHINPEKSRNFKPAHWLYSRDRLAELAKEDWLRSEARMIHIVGSNGKGSTAHYLSEIYQYHKVGSVGLYSSPHLLNVCERIRCNSKPIESSIAIQALQSIRTNMGDTEYLRLSYFEVLTILALYYFKKKECALYILEAGLGGRLDATRMATGDTIVLTGIDLEHINLLGNSYKKILNEKLAILSSETRQIFLPAETPYLSRLEIQNSMENICRAQNIAIDSLQLDFYAKPAGKNYLERNQRLAEYILKKSGYPVDLQNQPVFEAPPGRLEKGTVGQNTILFDTAHNPAAIRHSLLDMIEMPEFPGPEECLLVLGLLVDRNPYDCLVAARRCGFLQLVLLSGDGLAELSPTQYNLLTQDFAHDQHPALQSCPANTIAIHKLWSLTPSAKWVVILGSHRHYSLFKDLSKSHA